MRDGSSGSEDSPLLDLGLLRSRPRQNVSRPGRGSRAPGHASPGSTASTGGAATGASNRIANRSLHDRLQSMIELSQTLQWLIGPAQGDARANRRMIGMERPRTRPGASPAAPVAVPGRVIGRIEAGRIVMMPEHDGDAGQPASCP
jgi:hypothetical protein